MNKRTMINRIKGIIEKHETFSIGEVDGANGICINEMGNLVALVEYNIYDANSFSSDPIDDYVLTYKELSKEILKEILFVAELFETDQEKL